MNPPVTNVHVDSVNHDGTNAAAGFHRGAFRYHIWFNPKIGRGSAQDTLHKNPIDKSSHARHQACDAKAAANRPMIDEMWRQIELGGLIAEALADQEFDQLRERAEIDNHNYDGRLAAAAPDLLKAGDAIVNALEELIGLLDLKAETPPSALNHARDAYAAWVVERTRATGGL